MSPKPSVSVRSLATLLLLAGLGGCALDAPSEAPASTSAPLTAGRGRDALAAGGAHACLVQANGRTVCWGANDRGQLGDGTTTGRPTPVSMTGVANAIEVAAGDAFTCVLMANGQVLCAGANDAGQLGRGSYGPSSPTVAPVDGLTDAIAITAAGSHACALRADGTASCWGQGARGQLGGGTYAASAWPRAVIEVPPLAELDAGAEHTCGVAATGATWCWGAHDGATSSAIPALVATTPSRAIAAGADGTCSLDAAGRAQCWGASAPSLGTTAWRDLDRAAHVCVVTAAGRVQCLGANAQGELGDGTTTARSALVSTIGLAEVTHVALGDGFSCAQHAGGSVSCWGRGTEGQLGDGESASRAVPLPVLNLSGGWDRSIAIGASHSCFLSSGTARCSGAGTAGQLGDGRATSSTTNLTVATDVDLLDVAVTGEVSIGLGSDGALYAWGREVSYAPPLFGDGPTVSSSTSPVPVSAAGLYVQVAATSRYACALGSSGGVVCWGDNSSYSHGEGVFAHGTHDGLVDRPYGTGLSGALKVATGGRHVCALGADGRVLCRGSARSGQLGDGTVGGAYDYFGPRAASGLSDAIDVAAGDQHTCALRASGRVVCWGDNVSGQIGDGTTWRRSTPTNVGSLTARAEQVVAGRRHTCALATDGSVWCWGDNASGQLGDGTTTTRRTATRVSGLSDAVLLAASADSTCAARATGTIVCWGENGQGQLGIASTSNALVPTAQRAGRVVYAGGPLGTAFSL